MSAPSLIVQVQGQTVISADNANTYEQTCDTIPQLRGFTGVSGMQVGVRGITAPNDGGGGDFYWNPTATGPDDNLNVIVPTGSALGAWIRLTFNASGAQGIFAFKSTANLLTAFPLSTSLPDGTTAVTSGRTAEGDGGGATFFYKASDTTTADNGGTIRVDNIGRRWYLDYSGAVNILWFATDPTGSTDSAPGIRAAIAVAGGGGKITIPGNNSENFKLNSGIQFGGYSPYNNLATEIYGIGRPTLNFNLPAIDRWTGTGSQKIFTLAVPIGTDVASVFDNGALQQGNYTLSGSTLTFGTAPTIGHDIVLARDGITIASNFAKLSNMDIEGSFLGGDLVSVRGGTFPQIENVSSNNAGLSCFSFTPTVGYGPNWIENIQLYATFAGACREAGYKFRYTANSFINLLNGFDAHSRSGYAGNVPNTTTATVTGGPTPYVTIAGYTFSHLDIGRWIRIAGAGLAGVDLITQILAGSAGGGNCTLASNAETNVAGAVTQIGSVACHLHLSDAQTTSVQGASHTWITCEADAAQAGDDVVSKSITSGAYLQAFTYMQCAMEATGAGCPGYGFLWSVELAGFYLYSQNTEFTGITSGIGGTNNVTDWQIGGPSIYFSANSGDPGIFNSGGYRAYAGGGTTANFLGFDTNPTQTFNVAVNGNVTNTNNSYGAISAAKLKQDIVPATSQWDDVKALAKIAKKYHLKSDPEGQWQLGLVAEDVEEISPGLVEESQDFETDFSSGRPVVRHLETKTKAVKYSIAYMKGFAALGEALERIEALEKTLKEKS